MTSQIAWYNIISPSYACLNSAVVCTCIVHIPDIPLISIVTVFIKSFYNFISTATTTVLTNKIISFEFVEIYYV